MSAKPSKRVLIVGGVAGGATAAARLRRLDEFADIVLFERGPDIAFANCGLPYHIGGEIPRREDLLVQTVGAMRARFNLDIRTRHEVVAIEPAARRVTVRDLEADRQYTESYDYLLLAPGAAPIRPPLPGVDLPQVCTLRNLPDTDRIKALVDRGAGSAVVVGAGFIGLEMAENLRRRGLQVTVVELLPQVLPPFDPEMVVPIYEQLTGQGIDVRLNQAVTAFAEQDGRLRVELRDGQSIPADLAILAVGVRPDTDLARAAGLKLNERGAIVVDEHMRTSDLHIFAVGDAVEVRDAVLDEPTMLPLAGPANRQARIAADNICGRPSRFRGVQGTAIVRVFDTVAACTGASAKRLRQRGAAFDYVYVRPKSHAGYYPGAQPMTIKLLYRCDDGRVLGAQIVGGEGVDKRIDVLAVAIQAGLTACDLEQLELAYAPQFGSAKDPLNIAGFVAANKLRGDVRSIEADQVDEQVLAGHHVIDVRNPEELRKFGSIPGADNIPLPLLREQVGRIGKDKPLLVTCQAGQRGYYACRLLGQLGFDCTNLGGGYATYAQACKARELAGGGDRA